MSESNIVSLSFLIVIIAITLISIGSYIISYIFNSVAYMKCIQKTGEKGWKGWIPFYSDYIMYKIVGLNGFLVLVKVLSSIIAFVYLATVFITLIMLKSDVEKYVEKYNYNSNSTSISYKNSTTKNSKTSSAIRKDIIEDATDYMKNDLLNQPQYSIIKIFNDLSNLTRRIASIAVFIIHIFFAIKITKAYNLKGGYVAGVILLPTIFLLIIGFGKSKYVGDYKPA